MSPPSYPDRPGWLPAWPPSRSSRWSPARLCSARPFVRVCCVFAHLRSPCLPSPSTRRPAKDRLMAPRGTGPASAAQAAAPANGQTQIVDFQERQVARKDKEDAACPRRRRKKPLPLPARKRVLLLQVDDVAAAHRHRARAEAPPPPLGPRAGHAARRALQMVSKQEDCRKSPAAVRNSKSQTPFPLTRPADKRATNASCFRPPLWQAACGVARRGGAAARPRPGHGGGHGPACA